MSTSGPGDINRLQRVQPIDGQDSDEQERKNRKKVLYQGRTWSKEKEEDVPLAMPSHEEKPKEKENGAHIYANRLLLEKAKKIMDLFPSMEEKCAQLCFFELEANYDREKQQKLSLLVQQGQVGGLFFSRGDFRREAYLVEMLQGLSTFPLLIGNDFLHGLSFYFQRECTPQQLEKMNEIHLCDLGKAVVFQNRKLGVQLQLVREGELLLSKGFSLEKEKIIAFANGIREAHGIVGKAKRNQLGEASPHATHFTLHAHHVQEVFSLRTLYFLDLTKATSESEMEEMLMTSVAQTFDILLLPAHLEGASKLLANLVGEGKISIGDIEKRLLKIILLKMMAFPMRFR